MKFLAITIFASLAAMFLFPIVLAGGRKLAKMFSEWQDDLTEANKEDKNAAD